MYRGAVEGFNLSPQDLNASKPQGLALLEA
jgi:hypothetical protein